MKSIKDRILGAIKSVVGVDDQITMHSINYADAFTFKQKDGSYRWVMFSSNSYEDSDKEVVSQKALEDDVKRADLTGEYGDLDWWHIPQLKLGTCDFNVMHGKILIESGTFDDPVVGAAMARHAKELQGSITFRHPEDNPDSEGVFHNIKRERRAMLPVGKASNFLTAVPFISKEKQQMADMNDEKIKEFVAILGDDEKVKEILDRAKGIEKKADLSGLRSKAKKAKEYMKPEDEEDEEEDKQDGETTAPEDVQTVVEDIVAPVVEEVLATLDAQADAIEMVAAEVGVEDEVIAALESGMTDEAKARRAERRKARKERAAKEIKTSRLKELTAQITRTENGLKVLTTKQPKIVKGRRASESDDTVVTDPKIAKKDIKNDQLDPIGDLFKGLKMGQ